MRNHSIVAAGIAVLVTLAAVARPCHSTDPVEDPGSADDMLAKLGTARGMNGSAIIFRACFFLFLFLFIYLFFFSCRGRQQWQNATLVGWRQHRALHEKGQREWNGMQSHD